MFAVEDVVDQIIAPAVDDAQMEVHTEFKLGPAHVGQAESSGPLAGLHRLLKLLDRLHECGFLPGGEAAGGVQEGRLVGVPHQLRRLRWRFR